MDTKQHHSGHDAETKLFFFKGVHFVLTVGLFLLFWYINSVRSSLPAAINLFRHAVIIAICYTIIYFFFSRTYNCYLLGYTRIRNLVLSEFISQLFSFLCVCAISNLIWNTTYHAVLFFALIILQGILDIIWAKKGNAYYYKLYGTQKAILVYRDSLDKRRFDSLSGKPFQLMYTIEKELRYTGDDFSEIQGMITGYDAIFVAGINSRCRNGIAKYCMEQNIAGYFVPHVGDVIMQGAIHIQSFDSPILFLRRKHIVPEYRYAKRLFDILFAAIGLLLLSPLMMAIAAAVRISDGGPAFYQQERLTINGKIFKIIKFRSMKVDAEKDGIARLSTGDNDDRVTPIGRFLRRYRLDELPQLFNILKGDLSFVGPRPERPEIANEYYKGFPGFSLRLQIKAGLTGYAQVYGRYNTDPYEKLLFDLMYMNKMGLLTDIKLIFATISTLFSPESTKGVGSDEKNGKKREINDQTKANDQFGI